MTSKPRPTKAQQERKRQANLADFWNGRLAAAKTPAEQVAVWFDACRSLVRNAERRGDHTVATALASHLHDFFRNHTT